MYLLFVSSTTFRFRFHFCVRPFGGTDGGVVVVAEAETNI